MKQLGDLFGRNGCNYRAFMQPQLHESCRLQLPQCFAHRHAAHFVFARERILNELIAFLELATQDSFLQGSRQSFRQPRALYLIRRLWQRGVGHARMYTRSGARVRVLRGGL